MVCDAVNAVFRSASPGTPPAHWQELRAQWELGHLVRFVLHLTAFTLLLVAVLIEPRRTS
jgi:hypothetical protein